MPPGVVACRWKVGAATGLASTFASLGHLLKAAQQRTFFSALVLATGSAGCHAIVTYCLAKIDRLEGNNMGTFALRSHMEIGTIWVMP